PNESIIGTGPAEAFILRIKVSFFSGIILGSPYIFYQLWLFVAPGLYESERKLAIPFMLATTGLFLLGVWFCYEVIFPFAFDFFKQQYEAVAVTPAIRMTEHLSLVVKGLLGFGIVFEMPVLAFFLGKLGWITDEMMIKGFRYAVVIIFIASAMLTPPDVLTQFLMAIPLIMLYGLSILIVRWTSRNRSQAS
ncbi:MAG: twin-arginine translocase subunit TatC, partial [Bdellovibrionales bacterium]|nr:twin-arginine translocase subunit TatC [Bdellovibrionales bacterium]